MVFVLRCGRRIRRSARVAAAVCALGAPVALSAQDTAPALVSRTGGGGAWSNPAELQAAAKQGNPRACAQLGEILLRGGALPRDGPRALILLEQAARAGEASAAFRIGMLLDDGIDVTRDRIRALAYFRAAAAGGAPEAFHNIGAAYAGARGVRRDYVEALGWLILAAKKGDASGAGAQLRAHLVARRHPEWIAAAERRAPAIERELAQGSVIHFLPPPAPLTWGATAKAAAGPNRASLTQAADRGDADAQLALAGILLAGEPPEDPARAVDLLERSAKSGRAAAAEQLAEFYGKGTHVPHDDAKAFAYTLQAAQGGLPQAMFNVGARYANGRGTDRDFTEALAWLAVAKHYGLDRGQEKRIRDYLARSQPEQIPLADQRAADRIREIDASPRRAAAW
jgi:TPR repeat protein